MSATMEVAVKEAFGHTKYKDVAELNSSPQDLFIQAYQDFNLFAGLCIPHIIRFPFPPLYIAIWQLIVKATTEKEREAVIRYAIGLPRGFAKTTFLKILAAWLIVYDKISFLLLIGSTEKLAQNFLADLNDILGSRNIEAIYGAWTVNLAVDNKEEKKCSYRRRIIILMAAGAGTSVRGINLAYERPDFLLCDDMQTKENADSETESEHLLDWFTGTLLKVVDPYFATILYSGNMYPQNCILDKLQENPYWISVVTGCILADKKSLWEEVRPLRALYNDFKHDEALGKGHIWFSEMMNQPLNNRTSLLPNGTIPPPPIPIDSIVPDAGVAIIDPAGLKKTSDDNVVSFHYIIGNRFAVMKLIAGASDPVNPIQTPKEVIHATVKGCLDLGIRVIAIEDVAYQQTLEFWFKEELQRAGLLDHFIFIAVNPRRKHKESRIVTSVSNLLEGNWFFADDDARQRYIFQALAYKIGKPKQRDDILDTEAYIEELRVYENWSIIQSVPLSSALEEEAPLIGVTPF
jgi:hypothetical protein